MQFLTMKIFSFSLFNITFKLNFTIVYSILNVPLRMLNYYSQYRNRNHHTTNSFPDRPDHLGPCVGGSVVGFLLRGVMSHLCGLTGTEVNKGGLSLSIPHPSVIWSNQISPHYTTIHIRSEISYLLQKTKFINKRGVKQFTGKRWHFH